MMTLAHVAQANIASVGTIEIGGVPLCAGFVSGPSEVTTAWHCVSIFRPEDRAGISFVNQVGQRSRYESTLQVDEDRDLIVMRMSGAENLPALESNSTVTSDRIVALGWDGTDSRKLVPIALKLVQSNSSGMIQYELPSLRIASGSPLIQGESILGVHLGRSQNKGDHGKSLGEGVSFNPGDFPRELNSRYLSGNLLPDSDVFCVKTVLGLVTITAACAAGIGGLSVACVVAPPSCPVMAASVAAVAKLCGVGMGALGAAVIACAVKN